MTDNEIIDAVLNKLLEAGVVGVYLGDFLKNEYDITNIKKVYAIAHKIEGAGLASLKSEGITLRINSLGTSIAESGGWLKYIEAKEIEAKRQRDKEDLDFKKSKVDFKLAKKMLKEFPTTQKQAKWGLIIAAIVGLVQLIQILVFLWSTYSSD